MALSRRNFLGYGPILAAAMAIPSKFFGAVADTSIDAADAARLFSLSKESFMPYVNTGFAVVSGTIFPTWLSLLSVEDLNPRPTEVLGMTGVSSPSAPPTALNTFALRFLVAGETLPQGTYTLEHSALGRFPLFIVPSNPDDPRPTYTAIINQIMSPVSNQITTPIFPKLIPRKPVKPSPPDVPGDGNPLLPPERSPAAPGVGVTD